MEQTDTKLRVGIIGIGHLGRIHAGLWQRIEGAVLSGVFDVDEEKATAEAAVLGCSTFGSVAELLENVDAVTIASPTSTHFEIAAQCLRAGKHCLIEKPITATYAEAQELLKIVEESGLVVQVGHVERFNPVLEALRDYDPKPMFIEAHRLAQFKPRATDVSVVHDLMIHDIDIVLWLVKDTVESIDASGVAVLTKTPDIANARLRFRNGCVANLTASRMSVKQMRKIRLFQKNAYISLDLGNTTVDVFRIREENERDSAVPAMMLGQIDEGTHKRNIVYEQPEVLSANAILGEQDAFTRAILNGAPIPVTAAEGAEALRIAEEIAALVEHSA